MIQSLKCDVVPHNKLSPSASTERPHTHGSLPPLQSGTCTPSRKICITCGERPLHEETSIWNMTVAGEVSVTPPESIAANCPHAVKPGGAIGLFDSVTESVKLDGAAKAGIVISVTRLSPAVASVPVLHRPGCPAAICCWQKSLFGVGVNVAVAVAVLVELAVADGVFVAVAVGAAATCVVAVLVLFDRSGSDNSPETVADVVISVPATDASACANSVTLEIELGAI